MSQTVPSLRLQNDIVIPAEVMKGFLWGGIETGIQWIQELPALVNSICQRYDISALRPSPELRMNLVLFGESATHGPIVIKLAQPHPEVINEITCLRVMSRTERYPRLIAADEEAGWSLQERVQPGEMLQTLAQAGQISDAEATRVTAHLIRELVQPLPDDVAHPFPDLHRWLQALWYYAASGSDVIPADQVELALRHARDLIERPQPPMLLHGDFHHGNILQGESDWKMIDPKGIFAEAAFEVGPFFYNPIGLDKRSNLIEIFTIRLDILAEVLEIDRVRLWKCALVTCVLSDCWSLEGGNEYLHYNTVTAALMQMPERFA